MKKIQKIIIGIGVLALALSLTSSLVLAAGGVQGLGGPCEDDADCADGLYCDTTVTPSVCRFLYPGVNCDDANISSADALICKVLGTLSIIFSLVLVLAVLYFVWGVVQYVTAGGDEEKAGAAKKTMMYGIIALVVIVAVAGILAIATNYLDITNAIKLPFIGG